MKRIKKTKKHKLSHNSALSTKVGLRRWLVERLVDSLGRPPRVLDCFAAGGMLWERAYDKTPHYLGIDLQQFDDARRMIVCDSRRFLRHADAKLEQFDLFDLDAYGSPMEHLALICHRLRVEKGRQVGFALTDGLHFASKMSGLPVGMLKYIGMARHKPSRVQNDYRDDIADAFVAKAVESAGLRIVEAKLAKNDGHSGGGMSAGGGMRYSVLLCEGA